MTYFMLDHPGWDREESGPVRAVHVGTGTWLVTTQPAYNATLTSQVPAPEPPVDVYDPADLDPATVPPGLYAALQQAGPVARLRNPDLWDALATAIIRQVIRAVQARALHQRFRAATGQSVGATHLMPGPAIVAVLEREAFAALGMAFHARPLRAAADHYLVDASGWTQLAPPEAVKALQSVPRIGPWTASAAIADHTGDFALYPYGDLAVRTWAARADPTTTWPATDAAFAEHWRQVAGPCLSTLTALTLAWGDRHVHQSHLADPGSQP